MFKLLAAFVMAFAIVGSAPVFAHDKTKVTEPKVKRERVVVRQDNWPVNQDRYPRTAQERFLNDYHWCDRNFACGGGD